ncbi:MAG: DUF1249 domain-containing protein [Pseudomonadota bacterium]
MLKMRAPLLNDFYVRPKVRYKVNLPLQMAECEANFARLKKLLPSEGDWREFAVSHGTQEWLHKMHVIERSPYTTTLQLTQIARYAVGSTWLQMPSLTVRMYHDAELAEVLAWEGHKRLRPRYDYPNRSMYQCDEKLQINQFLGEWLSLCLKQGYAITKVMPLLK